MLNEEPAQSQDLQMMGMRLPLGIEKGKDSRLLQMPESRCTRRRGLSGSKNSSS